jgi:mono/diheme cytochrome c family protein
MMLAAISTPEKLGFVVAVVLVVGWGIFILSHVKRSGVAAGSEAETAPNRKVYVDDDVLEGPKLERVLVLALILLVIVGLGLPLYWLNEPTRQAHANIGFDNRAVEAGFTLFQPADSPLPTHPQANALHFGCATCHGNKGQGGSTNFSITQSGGGIKQVTWQVPALNTVLLRYTPDTVRNIIIYGRSFTPMPAWGLNGGGPMNDEQIDNLVAYLQSIQLSPAQAKEEAAQYGTSGPALFNAYCARCHTKGYSFGQPGLAGGGAYGPNLTNGSETRQFPNLTDHVDFVTKGAEFGKAYGSNGLGQMAPVNRVDPEVIGASAAGGGMPFFGQMLTPDQLQAVVNYERGL